MVAESHAVVKMSGLKEKTTGSFFDYLNTEKTMCGIEVSSTVALIKSPAMLSLGLHARIQCLARTAVIFENESKLLSALGAGKRFDLLLLVEEDFHRWNCLAAVARAGGIPTLLVTNGLMWSSQLGPGQVFKPPALLDFLSSSATDLEIDIRIKSLLKRARQQADALGQVKVESYVLLESV